MACLFLLSLGFSLIHFYLRPPLEVAEGYILKSILDLYIFDLDTSQVKKQGIPLAVCEKNWSKI